MKAGRALVLLAGTFLDEVDRGQNDDETANEEPEGIVGGNALGIAVFEKDEEQAGKESEEGPGFSEDGVHERVRLVGALPESKLGVRQ